MFCWGTSNPCRGIRGLSETQPNAVVCKMVLIGEARDQFDSHYYFDMLRALRPPTACCYDIVDFKLLIGKSTRVEECNSQTSRVSAVGCRIEFMLGKGSFRLLRYCCCPSPVGCSRSCSICEVDEEDHSVEKVQILVYTGKCFFFCYQIINLEHVFTLLTKV